MNPSEESSENGEEMWISSEDYLAAIEKEIYEDMGLKSSSRYSLEHYYVPNENGRDDVRKSSANIRSGPMYTFCGAETAEHFFNKINGFYNEMMMKINTLKNTSVMNREPFSEPINLTEVKLFKDLKDTPEVQEKIKQIQQLDDDIKNVIDTYKEEKRERLKTQKEMCDVIRKNKVPQKDSCLFMGLCEFEESEDAERSTSETTKVPTEQRPNKFIKRNIKLAKAGALAQFSLTDEEKIKIEQLLSENDENEFTDGYTRKVYGLSEEEQTKMEQINVKLQGMGVVENEDSNWEKIKKTYNLEDDFLRKHSLTDIDEKIKKLKDEEINKNLKKWNGETEYHPQNVSSNDTTNE